MIYIINNDSNWIATLSMAIKDAENGDIIKLHPNQINLAQRAMNREYYKKQIIFQVNDDENEI
jgi:subtilisin-like proprotein convertase family protein